jgi:hypothetical protein
MNMKAVYSSATSGHFIPEYTRDQVTGEWRKGHNEKVRDLYFSPTIVRVIKSRRMRRAGHVARMGEGRGVYRGFGGET